MSRLAALVAVLVAAVALIDRDGRVLIAQRPEGKAMAGLWEFPGGKVEPGETPEAALIRELGEELGIDTWASCLAPLTFASHAYPDFHLLMPLYACRRWEGCRRPREHAALRWVGVRDLADLPDAAGRPAAGGGAARLALSVAIRTDTSLFKRDCRTAALTFYANDSQRAKRKNSCGGQIRVENACIRRSRYRAACRCRASSSSSSRTATS